ncbi:hypothetical protein [Flammeovirga sp. SubArs3]|nr:hypothetical protein [Flammeovirga sp. SubArs3]
MKLIPFKWKKNPNFYQLFILSIDEKKERPGVSLLPALSTLYN